MNSFFSKFTGRQRLFAFIFLLIVILLAFTFLTKDQTTTIIVSIATAVILFIARPIWLPASYGKNAIRRFSLYIALVAVLSYGFWAQIVQSFTEAFLKNYFPEIAEIFDKYDSPPALAYAFLLIVIFIVNYFLRDKTVMGIHENPIDQDIPDPTFEERLKNVVAALADNLHTIDIKTNWSSYLFTPLDAEVEIKSSGRVKRRITDLLKAIKNSNSRLFLVLGEPGSGKSVALRKLAQDLCQEVSATQKVPVYINLKEWGTDRNWTIENPPTLAELNDFVFRNLKNRDIITSKFFDKYYNKLYETGRLYFIFDSFDEIPAVLDEEEHSALIKYLSDLIFRFLKGARAASSQGILASRVFRKPTDEYQAETTLEIRAFSEDKIVSTFRRNNRLSEATIKRIFSERIDLANLSSNPFLATLLCEYVENNHRELPENQSSMYEDYIHRTLESCRDKMKQLDITKEEILAVCLIISDEMFRDYGFEVPVNELVGKYHNLRITDAIEILKFSRLGRFGTGDSNLFSFVHRRFAEYFTVQSLLQNERAIDLEVIPTDSQFRDALVLYCEVAPIEKAKKIANFCWEEMQKADSVMNIRFIHCLRFLKDAFKNRQECTSGFSDRLHIIAEKTLKSSSNILLSKLITESIYIFPKKKATTLVVSALKTDNSWVEETAIKSCTGLGELVEELVDILNIHFSQTSVSTFLGKFKRYSFSLRLIPQFYSFYKLLILKSINQFLFLIFFMVSNIFYPLRLLIVVLVSMLLYRLLETSFIALMKEVKEIRTLFGLKTYYDYFITSATVSNIVFLIPSLILYNFPTYNNPVSEYDTANLKISILFSTIALVSSVPYYYLYNYRLLKNRMKKLVGNKHSDTLFIFTMIMIGFPSYIFFPRIILLFPIIALLLITGIVITTISKTIKKTKVEIQESVKDFTELIGVFFIFLLAMSFFLLTFYGTIYIISSLVKIEVEVVFATIMFIGIMGTLSYYIIVLLLEIWYETRQISDYNKKMKSTILNKRNVYDLINSAKSEKVRMSVVKHLEQHYKSIQGSYPNREIFKDYQSEAITRLAKLEEKWLGLN